MLVLALFVKAGFGARNTFSKQKNQSLIDFVQKFTLASQWSYPWRDSLPYQWANFMFEHESDEPKIKLN